MQDPSLRLDHIGVHALPGAATYVAHLHSLPRTCASNCGPDTKRSYVQSRALSIGSTPRLAAPPRRPGSELRCIARLFAARISSLPRVPPGAAPGGRVQPGSHGPRADLPG